VSAAPSITDADHVLAAELAARAGQLLVALRADLEASGTDQAQVRAEGDRRSHELLMNLLAERAPGDAVLSEEGTDDAARLGCRRVWIVDPLDGTREFGEPGRSDWAVHVALALDGAPLVGAVALPARALVLSTGSPPGPLHAPEAPPRMVVSRSRPPAFASEMAERLGAELVPLGSAGAKAMAVVLGEADVYCHAGGQYEWDSAAPVAVARAAGLHATRLDGSPLRYNAPSAYLPDLLICHPALAEEVMAAASSSAAIGGAAPPEEPAR
jgi:3'(2'), 5'-bisphosphate nucleotidase